MSLHMLHMPGARPARWAATGAVAAALLLGASGLPAALAHDAVDLDRAGSIAVTLAYGGEEVAGGTFALYRVGDVVEDDGDYGFALAEGFTGSGLSLDAATLEGASTSAELAARLAAYAEGQGLAGEEVAVGAGGTVSFDGLEPGLYLLVQTEASEGFEPADPFLVGVPMLEDGSYVYDVDASPKVALTEAEEPEGPAAEDPGEQTPADETLPQTGQLNWPIPVLAAGGLALFGAGVALRAGSRRAAASGKHAAGAAGGKGAAGAR